MSTMLLGALAIGLFIAYLMRRRSRLRAEEDNG